MSGGRRTQRVVETVEQPWIVCEGVIIVEQCGRARIVREEVVRGKKGDVTTVWSVHGFSSATVQDIVLFRGEGVALF